MRATLGPRDATQCGFRAGRAALNELRLPRTPVVIRPLARTSQPGRGVGRASPRAADASLATAAAVAVRENHNARAHVRGLVVASATCASAVWSGEVTACVKLYPIG